MSSARDIPADIGPNHWVTIAQGAHALNYSEDHFRKLLRQRKIELEVARVSPRKSLIRYGSILALLEKSQAA